MEFTVADRESKLWRTLRDYYQARLQSLREKNDYPMEEKTRNILIGQIQEVKALLAFEKPGVSVPKMTGGI